MYCIHQTDNKLNELIVDIIDSEIGFYDKVINLITDKYKYSIIENITIDSIKSSICFDEGVYLLKNRDNIQLVKKRKCILRGLIYNSTSFDVLILFTWKLIKFDPTNCEFAIQKKIYSTVIIKTDESFTEITLDPNTRTGNKSYMEIMLDPDNKLSTETSSDPDGSPIEISSDLLNLTPEFDLGEMCKFPKNTHRGRTENWKILDSAKYYS